jgi:hypothetical protein
MLLALRWIACVACFLSASGAEADSGSYLLTATPEAGGVLHTQAEKYVPQEGDIAVFWEHGKWWSVMLRMAGSGPPDHSGMMIKLPDGRIAIMEAAPGIGSDGYSLHVRLMEARSRLHACEGAICIRRLKTPLTAEQSARLTDFALAQEGKPFAMGRLMLQLTPFRARGPLREQVFGKTCLNRRSWICSELVVTAGTVAGLLDRKLCPANTMYPLDLIEDDTHDLSQTWDKPGRWSPSRP